MDTQIIVVFCLCADMLTALHHHEDPQRQMSDAEVMTTAIVAMLYFKGNFCMASRFLYDGNYIPNMLGKNRFNRRLHNIAELFLTLFLLFMRFLPMIAIAEVKGVTPQADPHHPLGGAKEGRTP